MPITTAPRMPGASSCLQEVDSCASTSVISPISFSAASSLMILPRPRAPRLPSLRTMSQRRTFRHEEEEHQKEDPRKGLSPEHSSPDFRRYHPLPESALFEPHRFPQREYLCIGEVRSENRRV